MPLLHSVKPLYVNFNTVSSKLCLTPMGLVTGCHSAALQNRVESGLLRFNQQLGHWISSFAQVTLLIYHKSTLQRLSRLCKPGDPHMKGSL